MTASILIVDATAPAGCTSAHECMGWRMACAVSWAFPDKRERNDKVATLSGDMMCTYLRYPSKAHLCNRYFTTVADIHVEVLPPYSSSMCQNAYAIKTSESRHGPSLIGEYACIFVVSSQQTPEILTASLPLAHAAVSSTVVVVEDPSSLVVNVDAWVRLGCERGLHVLPMTEKDVECGDSRPLLHLADVLRNTLWSPACREELLPPSPCEKSKTAASNLVVVVGGSSMDVDQLLSVDEGHYVCLSTARWSSASDAPQLVPGWQLVNKYYTAVVDVLHVPAQYLSDSMSDHLRAALYEHSSHSPHAVLLLLWPPAGQNQPCELRAALQRLFALGKWSHVCVVVGLNGSSTPLSDANVVMDFGAELIDVMESCADAREDGPEGRLRLAEVLHCIEWPQRCCWAPTPRQLNSSMNRLLICAVGSTLREEELWVQHLMQHHLLTCFEEAPPGTEHKSSIVDVVPSMQEYVALSSATLHISNRYFRCCVRTSVIGGARSRMYERRSLEKVVMEEDFDAIIILTSCTQMKRMHRLLGAKSSESCGALQTSADSDWSIGLERGLRAAYERVVWPADKDKSLLGMIYVVDASSPHDIRSMEDILDVCSSSWERCVSAEEERDDDACGGLELVVADPCCSAMLGGQVADLVHDPPQSDGEENAVEGCSRVVEALQQHMWSHTTRRDCDAVVGEETSSPVDGCPSSSLPLISHEQVEHEELCVGCDLPNDYLVDPLTLRSEWVGALHYAQGKLSEGEVEEPSQQHEIEEHHHQELLRWMKATERHGSSLPRSTRLRQAELLMTALEVFL